MPFVKTIRPTTITQEGGVQVTVGFWNNAGEYNQGQEPLAINDFIFPTLVEEKTIQKDGQGRFLRNGGLPVSEQDLLADLGAYTNIDWKYDNKPKNSVVNSALLAYWNRRGATTPKNYHGPVRPGRSDDPHGHKSALSHLDSGVTL